MRLIDADAFLAGEIKRCHCVPLVGSCEKDYEPLTCILDQEPSIDAVPVVRCKGCKHSTLPSELTQRYGVPGTLTCHNRYSPCNRRNVGGEDFCSYGERREE